MRKGCFQDSELSIFYYSPFLVFRVHIQQLRCCLVLSHSCDLMDCSLPGSSVHGISQARVLEWVAISSSREIFQTQGLNWHLLDLLHCRRILYCWATGEGLYRSCYYLEIKIPFFCLMLLSFWLYNFCFYPLPCLHLCDCMFMHSKHMWYTNMHIHNTHTHTELLLESPGADSLVLLSKFWEMLQGTPLLSCKGMSVTVPSPKDASLMC